MKKVIKFLLLTVGVLIVLVALFLVYQFGMYQYEKGIQVAENSFLEQINVRGMSLARLDSLEKEYDDPINLSIEKPFLHRLLSWDEKWAFWNALRKFRKLEDCLLPEARSSKDLGKFNWGAIRTNTQALICLHYIVIELEDPERIGNWITSQGFNLRSHNHTKINPSMPYVPHTLLVAKWPTENIDLTSPYPFFSVQSFEQNYSLITLLTGRKGNCEFSILQNENNKLVNITLDNLASK